MASLSKLIMRVNPGLTPKGVEDMAKLYSQVSFEADVASTRPNVRGDEYANRGYTRLDTQEYISPNTEVGGFSISVTDRSPSFMVDYDVKGHRSEKGRTIKTNLFNQLAGWQWTSKNPPMLALSKQRNSTRFSPVLISVDDGRDHFYTLSFDTGGKNGVDAKLYTKPTRGEPRNRPSVKGRLVLGPPVGTIITLASKKPHLVYEYITVAPTNKDGLPPLRRLE
jgi:hypothetical protein